MNACEQPLDGLIGQTHVIKKLRAQIRRFAVTQELVLITGETGVGKNLIARALHAYSQRGKKPPVEVCVPTIPKTLIEPELFGREKGAYTGADRMQKGKVELAEGTTLILDEIGELLLEAQPKLLRFLDDGVFTRVGGLDERKPDVRILAATNLNIKEALANGDFRADLYYRISTLQIHVPPLRERPEDIPLLTEHFLSQSGLKNSKRIDGISNGALARLMDYHWPGNVRELRNVINRAVVWCDGRGIEEEHLNGFEANELGRSSVSSVNCLRVMEALGYDKARRLAQVLSWLTDREGRALVKDVRRGLGSLYEKSEAGRTRFRRDLDALEEHGLLRVEGLGGRRICQAL